MVFQFELVILNPDGSIKSTTQHKSLLEMAKSTGLPYHNLRVILARGNGPSKYKNSKVTAMVNQIKINRLIDLANINLPTQNNID